MKTQENEWRSTVRHPDGRETVTAGFMAEGNVQYLHSALENLQQYVLPDKAYGLVAVEIRAFALDGKYAVMADLAEGIQALLLVIVQNPGRQN